MSQGEFLVDLEWRAGTPLERTALHVAAIEGQIRPLEGIASVFALIGSSGQTGGTASDKKEHTAQLHVRLAPGTVNEAAIIETVRSQLEQIPDLKFKFSHPSYFSFRTPIEVESSGYSLQTLDLLAEQAIDRMRAIPGLADIRSSTAGTAAPGDPSSTTITSTAPMSTPSDAARAARQRSRTSGRSNVGSSVSLCSDS